MKVFRCDRCGTTVPFDAVECTGCAAPLGYVTTDRSIRVLETTDDPAVYRIPGHDDPAWRCLNASFGCNWMLAAGSDSPWCRSCRLTRGRPDTSRPDALAAWSSAEAAKRRLVHQLDTFALPIEARSGESPEGLAFDLVHLPGTPEITGHRAGVVTLDLAEVDDQHRTTLRRQLGEHYRTVMGHLRHEVGHHYWNRLVGQTDDLHSFRQIFGDERVDYGDAVERHYGPDGPSWDPTQHVTAYASSHPLEDWAESFAHYLHIVDMVDTAAAYHLVDRDRADDRPDDLDVVALLTLGFEDLIEAWRPVNAGVNAIAEAVGEAAVYPFDPTGLVLEKLEFVHERIAAHSERDRFYAVR